tara:strand:- start:10011 stop:10307 length:297 start_codon:yes stop_codon:yes gene_type:complete
LISALSGIFVWIKEDFKAWPLRFCLEVLAWAGSIGCAITMALTLPNPPFLILYPIFIAQCSIFAWSSWTRKSFGMIGNYVLLISIDVAGYIRFITLDF